MCGQLHNKQDWSIKIFLFLISVYKDNYIIILTTTEECKLISREGILYAVYWFFDIVLLFLVCHISLFLFIYFLFLCWVGALRGIYKNSYDIYIKYAIGEFTPSTIILHSPSPNPWNSFNRYHFIIYIHVYTVFALCSPFYTLSPHPSRSHWYQHPGHHIEHVLPSCSEILQKKKVTFLLV
jgi:hypothetical protein